MALKISTRGTIPPFLALDIMGDVQRRVTEGADIVHLEVGQPSSKAPQKVLATAREALLTDAIGYTPAFGLPKLRARLARHYRDTYGVAVDPAQIAMTTGSSGGFVLSFLAAFDVGDRVALACPGYPAYRNILLALGIEVVDIPVGPETRFQPTVRALDGLAKPIDGLIVASPSNPAGTMLHDAEMKALCDWCRDHEVRLISDEIYHGITYGVQGVSALAYDCGGVVINSFSKYFSMTGWRLGWLVAPEDLARPIECLAQSLFISPPTLSQIAALSAFDCREELDGNVARYRKNRDLLLEELPKAGFDKLSPAEGGFYLYADVSDQTASSEDLCRRMVAEIGVAVTPGVDFDPHRGHRFIRLSFAGAHEDMIRACRRLKDWRRN